MLNNGGDAKAEPHPQATLNEFMAEFAYALDVEAEYDGLGHTRVEDMERRGGAQGHGRWYSRAACARRDGKRKEKKRNQKP